jgi:hypothetical protein
MLIKQSGSPRRQVTKHTPARPSSSPNMLGPAANWLAAGLLMTFVVPRFREYHQAPCALRLPVNCLDGCWRRREYRPARDRGLDCPLLHLLIHTVSPLA